MARGKHTESTVRTGRIGTGVAGTIFGIVLALSLPGMADHVADPTPSTNDQNKTNGWAHFDILDVRVGEVDVEFVSTRSFASCFEYRSDGEPPVSPTNFNTEIHDGLWDFTCVDNSTATLTLEAEEYVEIRMVFGAERDERFDWTRIDVLQLTKDSCKDGGFAEFGFSNQGRCVAAVVANEHANH